MSHTMKGQLEREREREREREQQQFYSNIERKQQNFLIEVLGIVQKCLCRKAQPNVLTKLRMFL